MEDFAHALANFVRDHQAWAAPIVLVLAFGESLAFISLLIPAWGALVAIGALIGASGISFWPVWIAGGIGAALGDWVSYWFGFKYKKKVTPYEWGKDVAPGLLAVASVGHTPGHTSYVLSSGSGKVFIQSDVTNNPNPFATNPGWHAFFDQDAEVAEKTRRRVYDMVVADKLQVQGFHYPFPGLGNVEKDGNGYRVVPAQWNPTI